MARWVFIDRAAMRRGDPAIVVDDGTTETRHRQLDLTACRLVQYVEGVRTPTAGQLLNVVLEIPDEA